MTLGKLIAALRAALTGWNHARAQRHSQPTTAQRITRRALGLILATFLIITTINALQRTPDPAAPQPQPAQPAAPAPAQAWEAHIICQQFVRKQLHAPAGAKFPARGEIERDVGDETFHIVAHVDAQNLYGATLRKRYACTTQHQGGDNWRLIALTID